MLCCVQDARDRMCYYEAEDIPDLAPALKHHQNACVRWGKLLDADSQMLKGKKWQVRQHRASLRCCCDARICSSMRCRTVWTTRMPVCNGESCWMQTARCQRASSGRCASTELVRGAVGIPEYAPACAAALLHARHRARCRLFKVSNLAVLFVPVPAGFS